MTSSARCSNDGGIVRPSALAVLRLMTSSNFVGCSTGRSRGFAPFRILSTKRGAAPEEIAQARPVRHEAPGIHALPSAVYCRQAAPCCEVCEPCSVEEEHR